MLAPLFIDLKWWIYDFVSSFLPLTFFQSFPAPTPPEVFPASSEALPALSETLPAGSEAFPAASEAPQLLL